MKNFLKQSTASARGYGESRGFTLIEMLVVMAIFAIVATVLLFNYSDFSTSVGVQNLAEEIGLTVRDAQSYATSVRTINGASGIASDTFPAYGISLSVNSTGAKTYDPTTSSFALFADVDTNGNGITNNSFDNNGTCGTPAAGQECVENFDISEGNSIVSLCTDLPSDNSCLTPATGGTVNVVFHHPNPDAVICVNGIDCTSRQASYVKITVQSPRGLQRLITIWNTGQISVN
jgi:prepilin-type N-terminal cleavage/methylation domain-containing protein